jgi:hypothetical protein
LFLARFYHIHALYMIPSFAVARVRFHLLSARHIRSAPNRKHRSRPIIDMRGEKLENKKSIWDKET